MVLDGPQRAVKPMVTSGDSSIAKKLALLVLAQQLGNVRQACKVAGYSRDSFYRFKKLYAQGGEAALAHASRRKPLYKNRVDPAIEAAVVALALEQPGFGQVRVVNELSKRQLIISPAGVRSVWQRHGLETRHKRLAALESQRARDGLVLSQAQHDALEGEFAGLTQGRRERASLVPER